MKDNDTLIGNKFIEEKDTSKKDRRIRIFDEIVVKAPEQCVPLIVFDSSIIEDENRRKTVWCYHKEIMILVDRHLNELDFPTTSFPSENDIFPDCEQMKKKIKLNNHNCCSKPNTSLTCNMKSFKIASNNTDSSLPWALGIFFFCTLSAIAIFLIMPCLLIGYFFNYIKF